MQNHTIVWVTISLIQISLCIFIWQLVRSLINWRAIEREKCLILNIFLILTIVIYSQQFILLKHFGIINSSSGLHLFAKNDFDCGKNDVELYPCKLSHMMGITKGERYTTSGISIRYVRFLLENHIFQVVFWKILSFPLEKQVSFFKTCFSNGFLGICFWIRFPNG